MMMTKHEFSIFLATHQLTQKKVAQTLGITEATIVNYNNNGRYPLQFQYALKGMVSDINGSEK